MRGEPLFAALNVALAKARAVSAGGSVVIGADTVVALDGAALGKPVDGAAATEMLLALRGRAHEVLTGVALREPNGQEWAGVVSTRVVMRTFSDGEIAGYVARGEPFDKAGGYAVQDAEFRPAEAVHGCYLNVVGLPLCAVVAGLAALGHMVPAGARVGVAPCEVCRAGTPLVAIG